MVKRVASLSGLDRLSATTRILQRARIADPRGGMWEAADVQWWRGRPRDTDDLALPVWYDDVGPVAACGLTATGESWQVDVFAQPTGTDVAAVWATTMDIAERHHRGPLEMLVHDDDELLINLARRSGFVATNDLSGTAWMDVGARPRVEQVDGFTLVDRRTQYDVPHPMIARNGPTIESRLSECSLYDPTLDLAVLDHRGTLAGYALFWFDATTSVGLLEPMRVEEGFQRRGLARVLLTNGVERLSAKGAQRIKVGFSTEGARALYLGCGFVQTSSDLHLVRGIATPSTPGSDVAT